MERIRIGTKDKEYGIESIRPISTNILQIIFAGAIPEEYGDITVYNDGGFECSKLCNYSTVYKDEGRTVYLSNDGTVYQEDAEGEEPGNTYMPTMEELKKRKIQEINSASEMVIYAGVCVVLSSGEEKRFSLSDHDQMNLFGKQIQLASGVELLEYHADDEACQYYSAEDMQVIIQTAMQHVSYHQAYCNSITKLWVPAAKEESDLEVISYGVEVPKVYQSEVLESYLSQLIGEGDDDD
ncbi:MAG: acyl carrier protein [Lachnospiraceae bacterium]